MSFPLCIFSRDTYAHTTSKKQTKVHWRSTMACAIFAASSGKFTGPTTMRPLRSMAKRAVSTAVTFPLLLLVTALVLVDVDVTAVDVNVTAAAAASVLGRLWRGSRARKVLGSASMH